MPAIIHHIENNTCLIFLNRPKVFNSFNGKMAKKLQKILDICEKNIEIKSLIITGNGKAFCAGQDINEIIDPNAPKLNKIVTNHYNPIIYKIRNLKKPVICAVNGVAAGAGANIAISCDITISSNTAFFIQSFSKIGLIPDSGGTFFLPRLIGLQKSAALMFMGNKISADDAEKLGIIYKTFKPEVLINEAKNIAQILNNLPSKSIELTKYALNKSFENNLLDQLKLESQLQKCASDTEDFKEGINAFIEKRTPKFKSF